MLRLIFGNSTRTKARPQGAGTDPAERLGNSLFHASMRIIEECNRYNVYYSLENPDFSMMFWMPRVKKPLQLVDLINACIGLQIPLGAYRKRTKVIGNVPNLVSLSKLCSGEHEHVKVEGSVKVHDRWLHRST